AEAAYREALKPWRKLMEDHPEMPDFALGEAWVLYTLGNHLRDTDRAEEALDSYARVEHRAEATLRQEPRHADARRLLWYVHGARAIALSQLGRHEQALRDWDAFIPAGGGQIPRLSEFVRELTRADLKGEALPGSALADHVAVTAETRMFTETMV